MGVKKKVLPTVKKHTTKYTHTEIERRWLVNEDKLPELSNLVSSDIFDNYIVGTRMRLRKIITGNQAEYKLCKKYGKKDSWKEEITNIYLTEEEYLVFSILPALALKRSRYILLHHGHEMGINFIKAGNGPIIAECEFSAFEDAKEFVPPEYCNKEVSDDKTFEAIQFAQATK